jgi:hypothetical protein
MVYQRAAGWVDSLSRGCEVSRMRAPRPGIRVAPIWMFLLRLEGRSLSTISDHLILKPTKNNVTFVRRASRKESDDERWD